jgi:hypothetical protein
MMIQTAPEGEPHFISTMVEHMDFCGQIARAFGNDAFEPIRDPEALYAVDHHDRGWDDYDQHPGLDPGTRLPYLMAHTPIEDALTTNRGSPDHNERHHPYAGLLSSMHTWGLYNRRYGFSQFVVRTRSTVSVPISEANKAKVAAMLAGELERQKRLRALLAADGAAAKRDEKQIVQNYKHLQFCDTFALYFHLRHANERGEETYIHVPMSREADASLTLKKIDDANYSLDPFPFAQDSVTFTCRGRYVRPVPPGEEPDDLGAALSALPTDSQVYRLAPSAKTAC